MKVNIKVLNKGQVNNEETIYETGKEIPLLIKVEHDESEVMHEKKIKLEVTHVKLSKPINDLQLDSKGEAAVSLDFSGDGIAKIVAIYKYGEKTIRSTPLFLELEYISILGNLTTNRLVNDIYHNAKLPDLLTEDKNIQYFEVNTSVKNSSKTSLEGINVTFHPATTADIKVYDKHGLPLAHENNDLYQVKTDAQGIATIRVIAKTAGTVNIDAMLAYTSLSEEAYFIDGSASYLSAPTSKDIDDKFILHFPNNPTSYILYVHPDPNFDFKNKVLIVFCNNKITSTGSFDNKNPIYNEGLPVDWNSLNSGLNEIFYIVLDGTTPIRQSHTLKFQVPRSI